MTVTAVAAADGDDFLRRLRATGDNGHALWCDPTSCDGVCRSSTSIADADGRQLSITVLTNATGGTVCRVVDGGGNPLLRLVGGDAERFAQLAAYLSNPN